MSDTARAHHLSRFAVYLDGIRLTSRVFTGSGFQAAMARAHSRTWGHHTAPELGPHHDDL